MKYKEQWDEYIVQQKRGSTQDLHWEDWLLGSDTIERAIERMKIQQDKNPFEQMRIIKQTTILEEIEFR